MQLSSVTNAVLLEVGRARSKHGPLRSPEHGVCVIVEEVGELGRAVLDGRPLAEQREEAIQIAAMGIAFVMDCCEERDVGA